MITNIKQENHTTSISFDEIRFTPSIVTALVDLFRTTSRFNGRVFDKLSIEFCDGFGIDLVVTTALVMDSVKNLFLAMDQADDDIIICRLATTLRVNTSLLSLWLLVPLTETSAIALADAIRDNEVLEKISLSGSNFDKPDDDDDEDTDDDDFDRKGTKSTSDLVSLDTAEFSLFNPMDTAVALSEGLTENTTLKIVDISCCYLNDAELATIVSSLEGHPTLQSLDISRNSARSKTMNALANLIGNDSTPLARLDLREQTDGEPLDISSFSIAMHANRTIDTLKLSNNQLQDDQVIELIAHIKDNDTIQELDLQYNQITEVGLNYLTEHLNGMKSLAVLLLGGNAFGSDGQNILENLQDDDGSICTVSEKGISSSKKSSSNKQQNKKPSSPTKGKGFSAGGLFSGFGGGGNSKRMAKLQEDHQPR